LCPPILISFFFSIRVDFARERRDRDRNDRFDRGGDRGFDRGGGGGDRDRGRFQRNDRSPGRFGGRGGNDRGGSNDVRRRGNPPGRKTEYRLIVENLSSRTSWQVRPPTSLKKTLEKTVPSLFGKKCVLLIKKAILDQVEASIKAKRRSGECFVQAKCVIFSIS
jgi:hypothetical protein